MSLIEGQHIVTAEAVRDDYDRRVGQSDAEMGVAENDPASIVDIIVGERREFECLARDIIEQAYSDIMTCAIR